MGKLVAALAFTFYVFRILSPADAADTRASVAKPAPHFLLETAAGRELTLENFAGRPLVLNVFASWCPPCRQELPRIVSAARTHAAVSFVGVDEQEAIEMATHFASEMHVPYPIAIDHGQFAATYGATSLPETVFVDATGTVRAIYRGAIPAAILSRDLALIGAKGGGSRS